jgi:hypothetical protein
VAADVCLFLPAIFHLFLGNYGENRPLRKDPLDEAMTQAGMFTNLPG